jgi:hypothetical protein
MLTKHLAITICKDAAEAAKEGYVYTNGDYVGVQMVRAVIVLNGMESGGASVDLLFEDEKGQKYMTIISARLLSSVTEISRES